MSIYSSGVKSISYIIVTPIRKINFFFYSRPTSLIKIVRRLQIKICVDKCFYFATADVFYVGCLDGDVFGELENGIR